MGIDCPEHEFYVKHVLQMSAGSELENHIWKEDQWLSIIRGTHHLFCDCGEWLKHLEDILVLHHGPQWAGDLATKEDAAAHEDNGQGKDTITDEELLEAINDLENGGEDADQQK
nr:ORF2 [Torque teno felis virus]